MNADDDRGAREHFECSMPLRWSDQDLNGHINNARIVTLMEEARILWLNQSAAASGLESFRCPKVVAALTVEYHRPVNYGDELLMLLDISRIGNGSFTVRYSATQQSSPVFRGSTVLVPLERKSNRPRKLTSAETVYLSRYTETETSRPG
ncbi:MULTISPECIES: acyl-CoA thioesterase [unclassified Arthrobacter]|uniref:acyl-CoA thioesterase n=1 Tax=unclassified Arthrobacter TaxID=235627 RepID=UPI002E0CE3DF|nr:MULTISPECIES: thioesterase family protein [unclassified Arthrobacter]MEC5193254.1 acyl-CoA thioester hydrolase [Arthrobacter sp. MP_M4]MEC5204720.1 acyl-CoA thioester hydrolase [Arthrobacter sp. MP_M7]